MQAFVHLSDIWGDQGDALGLRSSFDEAVTVWLSGNRETLIVEASVARATEAASRWQHEAQVQVCDIASVDWRDPVISRVGVDLQMASQKALEDLDGSLRAAGFRRSGRAWGEAGGSRLYVRASGVREAVKGTLTEAKVRLGAAWVNIRDGWLHSDRRHSWKTRLAVGVSPSLERRDVVDDRYGLPLPPPPIINVTELMPGHFEIDRPPWHVNLDNESSATELAIECFAQLGVWPISFSYPKRAWDLTDSPQEVIAPIIPGFPYSFIDEHEYMSVYHDAYLGLTHRKAGWDCFRHVEILAAGAVPLMPDVDNIPEFSMVHYPKVGMAEVLRRTTESGAPPDSRTRRSVRDFFTKNLTSEAMAKYVLASSGLDSASRILFVDAALPEAADYLSVLTLIGLKQLLGSGCAVLYPVDYVYNDTFIPTHDLYGRGFGYTRVLDSDLRSETETGQQVPDLKSFDALVIGSVSRNQAEAVALLHRFPASRTIWIHGEDTPPSVREMRHLRSAGVHTFVRALHTGRR